MLKADYSTDLLFLVEKPVMNLGVVRELIVIMLDFHISDGSELPLVVVTADLPL